MKYTLIKVATLSADSVEEASEKYKEDERKYDIIVKGFGDDYPNEELENRIEAIA